MSTRSMLIPLALLLALSAVAVPRTFALASEGKRLGSIDLVAAFKGYERVTELQQKVNSESDDLNREYDKEEALIHDRTRELDATPVDDTSRADKVRVLAEERAAAARMKTRIMEVKKSRGEEYNRLILADITRATAAYGREHGFVLVVSTNAPPPMPASVVYAADDAGIEDVTAAVVERLNAEYGAARKGEAK